MEKQKTVDAYILKHEKWAKELELLREIILATGLVEAYKWSAPVYTENGKNVVGLGAFKNHMGIWFFQGALLKDDSKRLNNAQEGKTTAMRQWRFHGFEEVAEHAELIEKYVNEAKENWNKGKVIKPKANKPLIIPEILKAEFEQDTILRTSFDELNLTKKREYVGHIDSAKREVTKKSRMQKIIPMIKEGVGLNDKYRK